MNFVEKQLRQILCKIIKKKEEFKNLISLNLVEDLWDYNCSKK